MGWRLPARREDAQKIGLIEDKNKVSLMRCIISSSEQRSQYGCIPDPHVFHACCRYR